MTSVKEQVAGVYAEALAVRGFAALAIDHRHYGESGGQPRQFECPPDKIRDLSVAVMELGAHESVDAGRVGMVGVCLGAAYAAEAAAISPSASAFASVAGYFPRPDVMAQENAGPFAAEVESGRRARLAYEAAGVLDLVAAAGGPGSPMSHPGIVDYYTTFRAGVPNYRNEFAVMSREPWLLFDPHRVAERLTVPVASVHSPHGLAPEWAADFHARLSSPVAVQWLPAPDQSAFYDQPFWVNAAADLVAAHLLVHLT